MSAKRQMNRGKMQALYKYLPDEWIDFSVRGKERKQYIAHVDRWNREELFDINKKRLLRQVDNIVKNYASQVGPGNSDVPAVIGFGTELNEKNCDVLTPKADEEERGIVAKISPLTFYCKKCMRVYQFKDEESYLKHSTCSCGNELTQFRQIYFCQCGYATDQHPIFCKEHGSKYIKWDGKYDFICTKCHKKIHMSVKCPVCHKTLGPKVALDPAQFFPYSISLIDLIDEKLEDFIYNTDYGKYIVLAYWLNKISRDELYKIINEGIANDPEKYNSVYNDFYTMFMNSFHNEDMASQAARVAADDKCGSKYVNLINTIKTQFCIPETQIDKVAEMLIEYTMVKNIENAIDLNKAMEIAAMLNTSANPGAYLDVAKKYGIDSVQVCDGIPFVACSYGYTRVKTEYEPGVQLHAFKEIKKGRKNVFAVKTDTEGVLFTIDRKKIIEWLIKNGVLEQENAPDMNSDEAIKIWYLNNIKQDVIRPFSSINIDESPITYYVYRLIHSISHLLIRAVADIGGLGKDSLSEYIFPGVPAILIYCQNSQGFNLGSLSNTFEAYFDKWMAKANSMAQRCVFDPICIERQKACTGCLFLNEISCQHFNKDLDRSLIIGHVDRQTKKKTYGFWEE